MARCKIDKTILCGYGECTPTCEVLKNTGQMLLSPPPLQVIKKKETKGHKTTYYKIEKKQGVNQKR
jgi:hypothetical protein